MRRAVLGDRCAADLHLHDGVAAVEIAAHLVPQRVEALAGIVIAAGRVDEHARVRLAPWRSASRRNSGLPAILATASHTAMSMRADGDRALAVAARLFVGHHRGPDAVRIEIVAGVVEQRFGSASSRRGAKRSRISPPWP